MDTVVWVHNDDNSGWIGRWLFIGLSIVKAKTRCSDEGCAMPSLWALSTCPVR